MPRFGSVKGQLFGGRQTVQLLCQFDAKVAVNLRPRAGEQVGPRGQGQAARAWCPEVRESRACEEDPLHEVRWVIISAFEQYRASKEKHRADPPE